MKQTEWRPSYNLIEGELDNLVQGRVTGYLLFCRNEKTPLRVTLDLEGDFMDDIAGYRIALQNLQGAREPYGDDYPRRPSYLEGFDRKQRGVAGVMTGGLAIGDRRPFLWYPSFEWYAQNGKVVVEGHDISVMGGGLRRVTPEERAAQEKRRRTVLEKYVRDLSREIGRLSRREQDRRSR